MRIATFNANSIRARLDTTVGWLRQHRPDVLCIQETKVQDAEFPVEAFREAGYHVVFRGGKAHAGVALAATVQPERVRFGLDDDGPSDEPRLVSAKIGSVHVVNTYVPQGRDLTHEMYRYKLQWFDRLRRYFDRHYSRRMRLVWLGDLNVAPEPADVHNPEKQKRHVCFHQEVRSAFESTRSWGFVDVFRKHRPETGQYTFFDYRIPGSAKRNLGWRVDHILATPCLARRSVAAWIDLTPRLGPGPSDHTFVVAEFD